MNHLIKIGFVIGIFTNTILVKAQDMHFTQFYSSSVYLNPAFVGAGVCSRVSLTHRNQWSGVSEAYSSSLISFDHYIKRHNLGIGLLLGRSVAGTGNLTNTIINPLVAYEVRINRKLGLRFGVQPGFGINSINFDNLLFGDQIARGGNVPTIEELPDNVYYFDVGAGVLAYTHKYWLGVSFYHLNSPINSYDGSERSTLPIKYSAHGGYKFLLNDEGKSISTAFNYRGQQKFDQLDIGTYYTREMINIGLWYRGIPWLKAYEKGYSNKESIAIIFGIKTDIMNIGYSYDFTISRLNISSSHGSHEISWSYQFCNLKNQRGRRIFVECPSF